MNLFSSISAMFSSLSVTTEDAALKAKEFQRAMAATIIPIRRSTPSRFLNQRQRRKLIRQVPQLLNKKR